MGRDTGRTRFYLSDWRKHQIKHHALGAARFVATVVCSALLAVWLDHHYASLKRHALGVAGLVASSKPRRSLPVRPMALASAAPIRRGSSLGDHYSRYFEEALPLLRAEKSVRMVKIEMPSAILGYQESTATRAEGAGFRLQATTSRVPLLAVSRAAKDFLSTMRITFIDPKTVPSDVLKSAVPLSGDSLQGFLLVPDVSGDGAAKFTFSRK